VAIVQRGSQSVEAVLLKPKEVVARAGTGAGDYEGISVVADTDSESAAELLEEGQAFEAGIISGVEDAPDPDETEVTTHEIPQVVITRDKRSWLRRLEGQSENGAYHRKALSVSQAAEASS
jgi:hypothetical protein